MRCGGVGSGDAGKAALGVMRCGFVRSGDAGKAALGAVRSGNAGM